MARLGQIAAQFASNIDRYFDAAQRRLGGRFGVRPIRIVAYRGYGTREALYLKGRVLEDNGIRPASENDTLWDNLVNMIKRFTSREVPGARVLARFDGLEREVTADREGFFEVWIEPHRPLPADVLWHRIGLELLAPRFAGGAPVRATGEVYVPPPGAQYGVISDIDDTVIRTSATDWLRMMRIVFLGNAHTRLPFEGVAAFYRALHAGVSGAARNPLLYVSSSAWNLYDVLCEFFQLHAIPIGPVLFLRDWGLTVDRLVSSGHRSHKLKTIRKMLDLYADLSFILIGDSGQEDPEIYYELIGLYPKRILAVYIRNVSRGLKRPEAIRALAEKVVAAGSTLILADNTVPLAEHAAAQGWISPAALPEIRFEKKADEAAPTPIEQVLGEAKKAEGPTVVVEGPTPAVTESAVESGAIEKALEVGDSKTEKPPTVIVEGKDEAQVEK
ncbi:MAG TPA: phosphatase domain-containing protein [Anaerolineae bacterium]|nr:phosphatase domain-containing protein [Anaerolineae bacterium]